jgi:hypothetical protein
MSLGCSAPRDPKDQPHQEESACFDNDHAGPWGSGPAHRAQMHETLCASGAMRSSVSGAIAALKHRHCVAFGSAAIAHALGDEQSGQRLGSIGCACDVMAEFTLLSEGRRSRCKPDGAAQKLTLSPLGN